MSTPNNSKIFLSIVGEDKITSIVVTENNEVKHVSEVNDIINYHKSDCGSSAIAMKIAMSKPDLEDLLLEHTSILVVKDKEQLISLVEEHFPTMFITEAGKRPGNRKYYDQELWSKKILSELPECISAARSLLEEDDYKVMQEDDIKFELTSDPVYAASLAPGSVGINIAADVLDKISELARKFGSWQPILNHLETL